MVTLPLAMKFLALLLGIIDICVKIALLVIGVLRLILAFEKAKSDFERKERRFRR